MTEFISPPWLTEIREANVRKLSRADLLKFRRKLLSCVDELTQAWAELEELGTDAYAEKLLSQARLRSMEIRGGSFEMDLTEAQEMAAAYVAMCRTMLGDAENYTETPIGFPTAKTEFTVKIAESPVDWYVLTVQRKWKLTPHEARKRAEAERDEARSLARFLRLELIDDGDPDEVDRSIREVELDLGEDEPLPDWLAADGQSDH